MATPTYIGVKASDVVYLFPGQHDDSHVQECFDHPFNRKYIRPISACGSEHPTNAIVLSLDTSPKSFKAGWVFGNNEENVDIFLGESSRTHQYINQVHFAIGFNQHSGILLLTNHSSSGTFVRSDGDAPRRLHDQDSSSILEKYTQIILPGYSFIAIIPRNSDDQNYQALLMAKLKGTFGGYMTPITPPEVRLTTRHGGYSFGNVIKHAHPLNTNHVDVVIAVRISSGDKFVAKCFIKREKPQIKEIHFLRLLENWKHENVVRLEDVLETDQCIYLVLPASPRGDLSQHEYRQWSELQKSHAALQILAGAQFLHASGIFHRDIKPENLLLFAENPVNIKIADLGSATSEETANTVVGTENFAPPEVIFASSANSSIYQTKLVDPWSIGVVLLTFYNNIEHYREMQTAFGDGYHDILGTIASACARSELELPRLIALTVVIEPQERLTVTQCYERCQVVWNKLSEELEVPPLRQTIPSHPSDLPPTLELPSEFSDFDLHGTPPPGSPNSAQANSIDTSLATPSTPLPFSSIYENLKVFPSNYDNTGGH